MKSITSKINSILDWITGRLDIIEEKIGEFEDLAIKTFQNKAHRERRTRGKNNINKLWESLNQSNIPLIGVSKGGGGNIKMHVYIECEKHVNTF